jgi:DNA-binding beta-propeller fold protein YncE
MALVLWAAPPATAAPAECLVRFAVATAEGDPDALVLACRDGDAACDSDGVEDGVCRVAVAVCTGVAPCDTAVAPECAPPTMVSVERGSARRRRHVVRARATDPSGRLHDKDRLRIVCEGPAAPRAVIVTSDFETGVLVRTPVATPSRARQAPASVHGDALVRIAGGTVFVVNRFLGDNLQILTDRLATRLQCSTGVGSNPHDVALAAPDKAYVTRYDREALWIVDPQAPGCGTFRRGTIDLGPFADADGLPEMSQMALVGQRLFVSLQRLDRTRGFEPTGPSWLAVIDTATDAVTGTIELVGRNALADSSGIQREPGTGKLLIPQAGNVYRTGDGGIERVDPEALVSDGFIVTETALGGTITDFVIVSPTKGYAIVLDEALRNLLVAFDPQAGTLLGRVFASQHFLSDVALAPDGTVWLADRSLPRPGVRIFDPATDEPLRRGVIDVGLPPFSMGFLP